MYFSTVCMLKKISHCANISQSLLRVWSSREISSGSLLQIHISQALPSQVSHEFPTWLPPRSVSLKGQRKVAVEVTGRTPRQMTKNKIYSMFFSLLQNCIMLSLSMTVNCWRQKLFCFLSSLSTSAELDGSCSCSCSRVGLHRNPPKYRILGCGAKSKSFYTVLRRGFVLCVFFRWRLLNLLWVKPWGIQCNFCLSWPALTHTQLAEAWRASESSRDSCLQEEFVGA